MTNPYRSQLAGERIPDKVTFTAPNQKLLTDFAVWDDFKLAQTSPYGFTVTKRTGDTKWRDKIITGMTCFAKMPHGLFSGKGVFGYDPATGVVTLEKDQSQEVHSIHLATIMGGAEKSG